MKNPKTNEEANIFIDIIIDEVICQDKIEEFYNKCTQKHINIFNAGKAGYNILITLLSDKEKEKAEQLLSF